MTTRCFTFGFYLLVGTTLGSCSLGNSVSRDVNSSNPAVAAQAQKVQILEQQVNDQKVVAEAEKTKLAGLEQQLEGAQQNLKGVKQEAKAL
ncbi:hypothetical protein [Hymenobacter sp. YC55]|uniref:hypothetical protein n=1 Tax=Hymenobacter sp. YC55 TaxID=3034019 RepID=UPI0023F9BC63|nr:hypothetical protein [Hymenobacter sp. YC55]MDF7813844.1 hypothetical protein [Hymenobacter sp. YC55]